MAPGGIPVLDGECPRSLEDRGGRRGGDAEGSGLQGPGQDPEAYTAEVWTQSGHPAPGGFTPGLVLSPAPPPLPPTSLDLIGCLLGNRLPLC